MRMFRENPAIATKNPAVLREQRGKRGDVGNRRKNPSTRINAEKFLFVGHPWDTRTGSAPLQATPETLHQPSWHPEFARHRAHKPIAQQFRSRVFLDINYQPGRVLITPRLHRLILTPHVPTPSMNQFMPQHRHGQAAVKA